MDLSSSAPSSDSWGPSLPHRPLPQAPEEGPWVLEELGNVTGTDEDRGDLRVSVEFVAAAVGREAPWVDEQLFPRRGQPTPWSSSASAR